MREELESFVNQGLQQGWNGWPLKGWSFDTGAGRFEMEDRGVGFFDFTPEESFWTGKRFRRLFQAHLQDRNRLS